ncbi:MAG: PAS domain S-box protein [Gammaproteobacteria bacterium]
MSRKTESDSERPSPGDVSAGELERFLTAAVDRSREGISLVTPDGRFVYANAGVCRMYGYSREEFLATSAATLDPRFDAAGRRDAVKRMREAGGRITVESIGHRRDGSVFPRESSMELVSVDGNELVYVVTRDISERKRIQAALELAEQRRQGFLTHTRDGVTYYEFDEPLPLDAPFEQKVDRAWQAVCVETNEAALMHSSLPVSAVRIGKRYGDFRDRSVPEHARFIERLVEQDFTLIGYDRRYEDEHGKLCWLEVDTTGVIVDGACVGVWTTTRDVTERKAAEAALLEAERKRAEFLARSREAVTYHHFPRPVTPDEPAAVVAELLAQSVCTECNDAAARLVGLPGRDALIGLRWMDVQDPADSDAARLPLELVESNFDMTNRLLSFVGPDGARLWAEVSVTGVFEDGACVGAWSAFRDVTERVEAERELRLIRYAMDHSTDAISLVRRDGTIEYVNEGACRMYGYSADELKSLPLTEIAPAFTAERLEEIWLALQRDGTSITLESTGRRRDGSEFPRESTTYTIKFEQRDLVCAITRDITDRKRAESALTLAARRLEGHVENTPLAVIEWDAQMRVTRWNPTAEKLFGWRSEEALGRVLGTLGIVSDHAAAEANMLLDRIRTGEIASYTIRSRSQARGGRQMRCIWYVSAVRDVHGTLVSTQALVHDVTEEEFAREELARHRDRLEELIARRTRELEAAQAEIVRQEKLSVLGQLTATVSHELRNPLGTIGTSVAIARQLAPDASEQLLRALDRAERNVVRCTDIIEELLDFTRSISIDAEATALGRWLHAVLEEHALPEGVSMALELDFQDHAHIDPEWLRRALLNLLANACEAMRDQAGERRLTIATAADELNVRISVADTGSGIAPDDRERIFEPLFSTKSFGVGLGLPIVRQVVEQHGGELDLESRPGGGTTVTLILPRRAPPAGA